MRTAITVGIQKDGTAVIITGPEVSVAKHRAAFNELKAGKDDFQEIQYWESGRGMRRIKSAGGDSGVNFNAAHPVEDQRKKNLPDLTPEIGEAGVVNFNSAHQVEHQQDPKKAAKLKDLTPIESDAPGKVNFGASKLIVDDSKKTVVSKSANQPKKPAGQLTEEMKAFVYVPSLKEVIAAGYSETAAEKIISRQQNMADALEQNPALSKEDLEKIGGEVPPPKT